MVCTLVSSQLQQLRVGCNALGLLAELNTFFLHVRRILKFANLKNSGLYRLTSFLMYITFIAFRIAPHALMSVYLLTHNLLRTWTDVIFILPTYVYLLLYNWTLLYELIMKDVAEPKQSSG